MKHASQQALDRLESLLEKIRGLPGLKEKKRGIFYRGSRAFLHFHEDASGLFADVRLAEDFERHELTHANRQAAFFQILEQNLGADEGPLAS